MAWGTHCAVFVAGLASSIAAAQDDRRDRYTGEDASFEHTSEVVTIVGPTDLEPFAAPLEAVVATVYEDAHRLYGWDSVTGASSFLLTLEFRSVDRYESTQGGEQRSTQDDDAPLALTVQLDPLRDGVLLPRGELPPGLAWEVAWDALWSLGLERDPDRRARPKWLWWDLAELLALRAAIAPDIEFESLGAVFERCSHDLLRMQEAARFEADRELIDARTILTGDSVALRDEESWRERVCTHLVLRRLLRGGADASGFEDAVLDLARSMSDSPVTDESPEAWRALVDERFSRAALKRFDRVTRKWCRSEFEPEYRYAGCLVVNDGPVYRLQAEPSELGLVFAHEDSSFEEGALAGTLRCFGPAVAELHFRREVKEVQRSFGVRLDGSGTVELVASSGSGDERQELVVWRLEAAARSVGVEAMQTPAVAEWAVRLDLRAHSLELALDGETVLESSYADLGGVKQLFGGPRPVKSKWRLRVSPGDYVEFEPDRDD